MIHSLSQVSSTEVADHYDELDVLYREVWGEHVHHGWFTRPGESKEEATLFLSQQVAALAQIRPGDKVCDIGCGYGATSRLLAQDYQAEVLGLTLSPAQMKIAASQKSLPHLRFEVRDWLQNNLPSASFDHLISIESSEHMPDKAKFFSEAQRVLKKNGNLVICAWLSKENPSPFEIRHLLEPICREGRLPSLGSVSDYRKFLIESGFEIQSFTNITQCVKRTWTIVMQRLALHLIRNPSHLKFLDPRTNSNADFLKSLFRIRMAYETGTMKYGIFCASKI